MGNATSKVKTYGGWASGEDRQHTQPRPAPAVAGDRRARIVRSIEAGAKSPVGKGWMPAWMTLRGVDEWPPSLLVAKYGDGLSIVAPLAEIERWDLTGTAPTPWQGVRLHHIDENGEGGARVDNGGLARRNYGAGKLVHVFGPASGETVHVHASLEGAVRTWHATRETCVACCGAITQSLPHRAFWRWARRHETGRIARATWTPARGEDPAEAEQRVYGALCPREIEYREPGS